MVNRVNIYVRTYKILGVLYGPNEEIFQILSRGFAGEIGSKHCYRGFMGILRIWRDIWGLFRLP
jgi:hypothetical protein